MRTIALPRTVIVGLSGAPEERAAVAWAIDECRRLGSRLVIAHACSRAREDESSLGPGDVHGHPGLSATIAEARRELGEERVTVTVRSAPAGAMLVSLASPNDVLVVGPPRHTAWTHWSSTAYFVARHAPCPVVVARPPLATVSSNPFAGHVVAAVDDSPAARVGLAFAFAFAAAHGIALVATTVDERDGADIWYDDQFLQAHLTVEPAALDMLSREVEPFKRLYPGVWVKRAVLTGRPAQAILHAADGATLLVLGSHTGSFRRRVVLGPTCLDAINGATCPVVIVQPPPAPTDQPHPHKEAHHVQA